jgi:hypothetical protein
MLPAIRLPKHAHFHESLHQTSVRNSQQTRRKTGTIFIDPSAQRRSLSAHRSLRPPSSHPPPSTHPVRSTSSGNAVGRTLTQPDREGTSSERENDSASCLTSSPNDVVAHPPINADRDPLSPVLSSPPIHRIGNARPLSERRTTCMDSIHSVCACARRSDLLLSLDRTPPRHDA